MEWFWSQLTLTPKGTRLRATVTRVSHIVFCGAVAPAEQVERDHRVVTERTGEGGLQHTTWSSRFRRRESLRARIRPGAGLSPSYPAPEAEVGVVVRGTLRSTPMPRRGCLWRHGVSFWIRTDIGSVERRVAATGALPGRRNHGIASPTGRRRLLHQGRHRVGPDVQDQLSDPIWTTRPERRTRGRP